jgi:hypothetical protein
MICLYVKKTFLCEKATKPEHQLSIQGLSSMILTRKSNQSNQSPFFYLSIPATLLFIIFDFILFPFPEESRLLSPVSKTDRGIQGTEPATFAPFHPDA